MNFQCPLQIEDSMRYRANVFSTCVISIVQRQSIRAHDCRSARHCTGSASSSVESVRFFHFLMTLQGNHSCRTCCCRYLSPVVSNPKYIGALVARHAPLGSCSPSFAGPAAGLIPQAARQHEHVEYFCVSCHYQRTYNIYTSKSHIVATMTIMAHNEGSKETMELVGFKETGVWRRHLPGINHSIMPPNRQALRLHHKDHSEPQSLNVHLWSKHKPSGMLCKILKRRSKTSAAPMRALKSGFSMPQQLQFQSS